MSSVANRRLPPPGVILARVAAKKERERKATEAIANIQNQLLDQALSESCVPPFQISFEDPIFTEFSLDDRLTFIQQILDDHNRQFECGQYYLKKANKEKNWIQVDVREPEHEY